MGLFLAPDAGHRLPVSLVTGFLGSGKTTLLNHLVQQPDLANTAIVINEFGDVPLDQHFIERSDGEVVVMANGCLCCSLQGDLEGVVGTLFAKRDRGDVPAFERLIVETTGLADPAPIMQMLLNNPLILQNFSLDAVITTIDGVNGQKQLREHEEAVKQVAIADRLLITKSDLASPDELDSLVLRLSMINRTASLLRVQHGRVAASALFGAGLFERGGEARDAIRWLCGKAGDVARFEDSHGGGDSHRHVVDIACFSLVFDEPLSWKSFSRWLTKLRVHHADRLLRVKGILKIKGEASAVAIHGVHHVFHPPVRLKQDPYGDAKSRIVFITRELGREEIEEDWLAFKAADRGQDRDAAAAQNKPLGNAP